MGKTPEKIATLRRLGKKSFSLGDPLHIMREMNQASDRALAIGCAALIEDVLKSKIIRHMHHIKKNDIKSLFGVNAPLGTFSAKILIGSTMRIFGPEIKADLRMVREIRNVFAHSIDGLSFDTQEISEACTLFVYPKKSDLINMRPPYPFGGFGRTMFFMTCTHLFSRFATPGQSDPDWEAFYGASQRTPNAP